MAFTRILVAIDGSASSIRAFDTAVELAAVCGARLCALAVEGPLPAYAATIGEVDEVKREKDRFFAQLVQRVRFVAAQSGVDLVVVDYKGHFLRDHLLGSTADRVAHRAACPVLVVT
jgi:nucleotide-binding universal stress UspA family protein